jgi:hypothetical protein
MDSSEADFYGLYPAELQNGAGQFVLPSQASVDAALNDASTNPDGTINPSFTNTSDASAYPLPMVTYALVSTSPQPPGQGSELRGLLTNLVNYSHTSGAGTTNPLPPGYYPLPDNMYQQALADITKDVNGPGATAPSPAAGGSTPGVVGGVAHGAGPLAVVGSIAHALTPGSHGLLGAAATPTGGTSGPLTGRLISVSVGSERYFVPLLLLLALLCLIGGPLLYMYPSWRRSRTASAALATEGPTEGGDAGGDP